MNPFCILLIEDNPDDAQLIQTLLKREKSFPHTITCAGSLAEGFALVRGQAFDVVLSDLGLPDGLGLVTVEKLRKNLPHLPVIVLTGDDDIDMALTAIKMGAQDFMPKGELSGFMLSRTIRHAIERKGIEQQLATKEEMVSLFVRHSPAPIAMVDTQMRYLHVSERWIKDFHLEAQGDIIGRSHYEVFPNLPRRWIEVHRRALAGSVEKSDEDGWRPRADGRIEWLRWELRPWHKPGGEIGGLIFFVQIITERKEREIEREKLIADLQAALTEVKTLSGMLPICYSCKQIRDDKGYWNQIETYIKRHTNAEFSHGLCPKCALKYFEENGLPVPQDLRTAVAGQKPGE